MILRPVVAGALLAIAAELVFATMGATIKHLGQSLPNEVLVFFRNLFGLAVVAPLLLRRGRRPLATRVLHLHLLRALAGLGAMYCFFYALARLPLAEAVLLKLTAPLFMPLIALAWLAERITARIAGAVLLGFAGVLLILRPGFDAVSPVALVALAGGLFAALSKVSVRRLTRTEPGVVIVFYFALMASLVSAVPLAWAWVSPPRQTWPLLLGLGLLATAGQLLMTRAYALAPAARIGPFTYTSVLFASAWGWLVWGERPGLLTWTGAALVVAAGIMTTSARSATGVRRPAAAYHQPEALE